MKYIIALLVAAALGGCGTANFKTIPDMFKHVPVEVPAGSGSE